MNLKTAIENIYTNKTGSWISKLEEDDFEIKGNSFNFMLQRWLIRNDRIRIQIRWLDKYVFCLPPKMFLSLVWTVIPKTTYVPRWTDNLNVKNDKLMQKEEEFSFILDLIRKQFQLSDNDYQKNKKFLIEAINNNLISWFTYYGVDKKYWKKYRINFNQIKTGKVRGGSVTNLSRWGLA